MIFLRQHRGRAASVEEEQQATVYDCIGCLMFSRFRSRFVSRIPQANRRVFEAADLRAAGTTGSTEQPIGLNGSYKRAVCYRPEQQLELSLRYC